ncbi:hypothetical protein [Pseudomonas sp. PvP006]|jgi:hypothetical protein|uniref:hypothetical protein n=1 Tax=Pseudomonas sp. PvP006 TaxID=3042286 RepID=UPI0027D81964|nr:hypothetical protein [Pseudomonas sp. PvP006]
MAWLLDRARRITGAQGLMVVQNYWFVQVLKGSLTLDSNRSHKKTGHSDRFFLHLPSTFCDVGLKKSGAGRGNRTLN